MGGWARIDRRPFLAILERHLTDEERALRDVDRANEGSQARVVGSDSPCVTSGAALRVAVDLVIERVGDGAADRLCTVGAVRHDGVDGGEIGVRNLTGSKCYLDLDA